MATLDDILSLNNMGYQTDAVGQEIGGASHYMFGVQAAQAAQYKAAQLRINAGQDQASAQRSAQDADKQSQIVASRALAVAAASGGGASDPGVVTIMARNAAEGAYRQQVALYQGDEKARVENMQADATEYEGKTTKLNSEMVGASQLFGAATTLMKGQSRDQSLKQRFGMGAPTGPY